MTTEVRLDAVTLYGAPPIRGSAHGKIAGGGEEPPVAAPAATASLVPLNRITDDPAFWLTVMVAAAAYLAIAST